MNSFPAKYDGFDKRPQPAQGPLTAFASQDLLVSSNRVLEQLKKVNLAGRGWNGGSVPGLGIGAAGEAEEP